MTVSGPAVPPIATTSSTWVLAGQPPAERLRLSRHSVARELFENPWKFDFFEAVLLLEELRAVETPDRCGAVGRFGVPAAEAVRFSVPISLVFPAATIQAIDWPAAEDRLTMTVNFLGLTGPSGILPRSYTERLQLAESGLRHSERRALREFLDQFNHRIVSLFVCGWSKYRFPVTRRRQRLQRTDLRQVPAQAHVALASVAGLSLEQTLRSTPSDIPKCAEDEGATVSPVRQRGAIERDEWLGLAGILAQRPMNLANLESALRGALGVSVRVRPFEGNWLPLEPESQSRLGEERCRLGEDAVVGERIWSRSHKIVIEVGELTAEQFSDFLPPGPDQPAIGFRRLSELVRVCIGTTLEFDIRPVLRSEATLETKLSAETSEHRLGIDSWLGADAHETPVRDAIFAGG